MPKATDRAINRDDTDVQDGDSALDEGATLPHVAGLAPAWPASNSTLGRSKW
jgi:hypothetical protein